MGIGDYTETDYLKDQVERLQQAEQERYERERRLLEERRREWREQQLIEERTAENWPEALCKQAALFRREAAQWTAEDDPDNFFAPGAQACDRALEIWKEIALEKKAAIEELEAQIALIKDSIRVETADRLEPESESQGWKNVVWALRNENPNNWLYW